MIKKIKASVAVILCAIFALSFTACYGDTNEWTLEIDGTKVDSNIYLTHQVNCYLQAYNKVSNEEGFTEETLWEKKIDEKDITQWILDETVKSCSEFIAVNKKFDELNLSISDETSTLINKKLDTMWQQYSNVYEKNGVSKMTYKKFVEAQYKSDELFKATYGENGEKFVPDTELQKYFIENYAKIKLGTASLKDSTGSAALSDEEKTALNEKFDGYVSKVQKGENMDNILDEYSKYLAEKKAKETAEAGGAPTAKTPETPENTDPNRNVVILSKTNTTYPADFTKKVFELENNKIQKFEITDFLIIAERYTLDGDSESFSAYKAQALREMKGDEFSQDITKLGEGYSVVKNDSAVKRFNPKNIPGRIIKDTSSSQAPQTSVPQPKA